MKNLFQVLVFVGLTLLEISLSEDDGRQPKEATYKKFVGERHYMIPFKTRISQPFQEGQTIHGVGMIKSDAKRIDINFHKGAGANVDLPLHLSIRFDEGKMVYNSYMNNVWGSKEQRLKNLFKPNTEMDIRIRIINNKYQIFANRMDAGTFEQRAPLDGVDHVSISGDLINLSLFHYGGRIFPIPYMAIAEVVPGKRLDISLLPTGKRFNINLYNSNRQHALQISVRFNEGTVVRNAMQNNDWGREEREGVIPIVKDEIFSSTVFASRHLRIVAHQMILELWKLMVNVKYFLPQLMMQLVYKIFPPHRSIYLLLL
ncbi:Galactoside-binding lectin family protein [Brugia malayi]|uniref:Galectin n=1 Tax=Brugia malayi TaxID=6279 RepID=A0A4E9FEB3_BRUMA|nr:Galactoside-binding lectin family protein [Brugia malayi]VIO94574.1 Galactoside-binding lectin family protein [Brugia malayi]